MGDLLSSVTLSALYGKLCITKRSTFRTSLAVFLLHLRLVRLSRCINLETFKIPLFTFGHIMPAIAYISGKYSLLWAARVGAVRPSRELIRFSRCPGGVALAPFSSDLKVSHSGATRQAPKRNVSKRTQSTVS